MSSSPEEQLAANATSEQASDNTSKWLIRLRRFASNDVDVVKILVHHSSVEPSKGDSARLRFIVFKDLEPASAYELCVEWSHPVRHTQPLVVDPYAILNAGNRLKCIDVDCADGGASNLPDSTNSTGAASTDAKLPIAMPLQGARQVLCREFFTLATNSSARHNFGQFAGTTTVTRASSDATAAFETAVNQRADESSFVASRESPPASLLPAAQPAANATGGPRKPKSLHKHGALRSYTQLLELSDLSAPVALAQRPFEVHVTRSLDAPVAISGGGSGATPRFLAPPKVLGSDARPDLRTRSSSIADALGLGSSSAVPLVACVFALVIGLTLLNVLVNTLTCWRRRARSPVPRRQQRRAQRLSAANNNNNTTLHSFYSDSEHSGSAAASSSAAAGGGGSRILIVGKRQHAEPFARSAYFELPPHQLDAASRRSGGSTSSSSGDRRVTRARGGGGGSTSGSAYLLADSARFPLGPSFDGDERHNADMVGLARKNYDNFINRVYTMQAEQNSHAENKRRAGASSFKHAQPMLDVNTSPDGSAAAAAAVPQHNHRHRHSHLRKQAHKCERHASLECRVSVSDGSTQTASSADLSNDVGSNASQVVCQGGTFVAPSTQQQKKPRIRFDKINPIYNMHSSSNEASARPPLTSFGHTNRALELASEQRVADESLNDQCEMCCAGPQDDSSAGLVVVECDDENCDASGQYFACCLDKQQQRFHTQQQQLELVVTRNGSLLPQPFIHPTGPSPCETPTCSNNTQNQTQQHPNVYETQFSARNDLATQEQQTPQQQPPPPPPPPPPLSPDAASTSYVFGETNHEHTSSSSASSPSASSAVALVGGPSAQNNARAMRNSKSDLLETIDRTDFDQRRNELASKLQLGRTNI